MNEVCAALRFLLRWAGSSHPASEEVRVPLDKSEGGVKDKDFLAVR